MNLERLYQVLGLFGQFAVVRRNRIGQIGLKALEPILLFRLFLQATHGIQNVRFIPKTPPQIGLESVVGIFDFAGEDSLGSVLGSFNRNFLDGGGYDGEKFHESPTGQRFDR